MFLPIRRAGNKSSAILKLRSARAVQGVGPFSTKGLAVIQDHDRGEHLRVPKVVELIRPRRCSLFLLPLAASTLRSRDLF
jgi:hypothetical protein